MEKEITLLMTHTKHKMCSLELLTTLTHIQHITNSHAPSIQRSRCGLMKSHGRYELYILPLSITDFDVSLSDQMWGPHSTVSWVLATHKGGNQFLSQKRYGSLFVVIRWERNKTKRQSLNHSHSLCMLCAWLCHCVLCFKHFAV